MERPPHSALIAWTCLVVSLCSRTVFHAAVAGYSGPAAALVPAVTDLPVTTLTGCQKFLNHSSSCVTTICLASVHCRQGILNMHDLSSIQLKQRRIQAEQHSVQLGTACTAAGGKCPASDAREFTGNCYGC